MGGAHPDARAGWLGDGGDRLERGAKQPTGAALALLNVIRRKGIWVVP